MVAFLYAWRMYGTKHSMALCAEDGVGQRPKSKGGLSHMRNAHRLFYPSLLRSEFV